MSASEWMVLAGGLAAIAWVNWYFFLAERQSARAAAGAGGVQEVTIAVRGGYSPAAIRVAAGSPVRLVFDRQESSGCSEEVVFGDFGVRKFLAPFRKTSVDLAPTAPGTYEFTCGMGMLRGKLIVEGDEATLEVAK
ncbi:MAG: cupredoxin domain-containing protein [Gemmatimonadaceae bacterium]